MMRPAYITISREASEDTAARSWLIQIIAVPKSRASARISVRICAWIETSSAVVGSSQMISFGRFRSAMAMATRWRMPPENWCGQASSRRAASGMPTVSSALAARSRAAAGPNRSWAAMASAICAPMVSTGFSVADGSWKTMAISRPRTWRSSAGFSPTSSRPSSLTEPEAMRPGGSIRPRIEKPVTLLPEPDSPTSPTISPASSENDTSLTARRGPRRVANSVERPSTASSGALIASASGSSGRGSGRPRG